MPLQNRVDPYGRLLRIQSRGTLMGNRGQLHNDNQEIVRNHRGKRWICCQLRFKDRHGPVMGPGAYTRLFFLDEATALSAGHRPCAECRRAEYNQFLAAWDRAGLPTDSKIDEILHQERLSPKPYVPMIGAPNGGMIEWNHHPHLVLEGFLYPWSANGYKTRVPREVEAPVLLLTPRSIARTIRAGYDVGIHESAVRLMRS